MTHTRYSNVNRAKRIMPRTKTFHVHISTEYFVNNHLRQSGRDFILCSVNVVNRKDVVVVENKCKAKLYMRNKKRQIHL